VAIAGGNRGLVGLKSDGSLAQVYWQAFALGHEAKPLRSSSTPTRHEPTVRETGPQVERIGNESDWTAVAASGLHFVALKRDGTIWGWGDNSDKQLGDAPKSVTNAPVRIGTESDWTNVLAGSCNTFAIKRDGSIWTWGRWLDDASTEEIETGPTKLNLEAKGVRAIISGESSVLILDEAGNVWDWKELSPTTVGRAVRTPQRLSASNWAAICPSESQGMAGLKDDGSLWDERADSRFEMENHAPVRLGKRTDWIAISMLRATMRGEAILTLAKDGTICRFGDVSWLRSLELLAPARRVTWSVNVLDAAK